MQLDVLIFGGGAAGLWCLDRFRRAGYSAILLEAKALGNGQTIQAQGIIHGGGKYALRGVRDFAAVRSTSKMPERWRRCLAGEIEPRLTGARVLSHRCYLWLPRGSLIAAAQSWGFMSVVTRADLLATRPEKVAQAEWPGALRDSATAVYALAEQVISTGSLLQALAAHHQQSIFQYDLTTTRFAGTAVHIAGTALRPRAIVLTAGEGNAKLLYEVGIKGDLMQRRPLGMVLLRGKLPLLFGHCIVGGKTSLTVTTATDGVWQIGGEIAERLAHENNMDLARAKAMSEIRHRLPGLDFAEVEIALYRAVRAEGQTNDLRRPSGVHVSRVAPQVVVAWPTKLSLTPVLADEVFALVTMDLKEPAGYNQESPPLWPKPPVARYPWEEAEWFPAV
jgi:FAD dependent oxidoreductase